MDTLGKKPYHNKTLSKRTNVSQRLPGEKIRDIYSVRSLPLHSTGSRKKIQLINLPFITAMVSFKTQYNLDGK